jgi:hypothetical protein
MLSEQEGCDVLARVFTDRGYTIARNVLFDEDGVSFHIDGWDAQKRVGFEYLTDEAHDHDDLAPDEVGKLALRMERGELFVLLVDEAWNDDVESMVAAANAFLDEVARRRGVA